MAFLDFIRNLFQESEEELLEEIEEAKKIQKDAELRLKELRERKKKVKKKKINKKVIKKNLIILLKIVGIFILGFVIFLSVQKYNSMPKPFKYQCLNPNMCTDCLVATSCIMFEDSGEEAFVHFRIDNKNNVEGDCNANISIIQDQEIIINRVIELGKLEASQKKVFKIKLELPDGKSDVIIDPFCDWKK